MLPEELKEVSTAQLVPAEIKKKRVASLRPTRLHMLYIPATLSEAICQACLKLLGAERLLHYLAF